MSNARQAVTEPMNTAQAVDYARAAPDDAGHPRPTSVTVLAGIGIVLGALMLLCKPAGLVVQMFIKLPQPNPVIDIFRDDPALRAFAIGSGVTGTLISLLLLLSSLGSLALRPWARGGMLAYAGLAAAMTIVGQGVGYFLVAPEVERAMRQSGLPQQPGMALMSGITGVAIGLLLGFWYPALILVVYTRPLVKAAFERGLPGKGI